MDQGFNPFDAAARIVQQNKVNIMAAEALAPCVARTSAAMVLNMQNKQVFAFYEERFHLRQPYQCWERIDNANIILCFTNLTQLDN